MILRILAVFLCMLTIYGCLTRVGGKSPGPRPGTDISTRPPRRGVERPRKPEKAKIYHTVREGDTLWRIAKAYDIPSEKIVQANGMDDTTVTVGRKLLIPGATHRVEVERYRPPKKGRKFVRGEKFGYPCAGTIAAGFGQLKGDQRAEGMEFTAKRDTKVVASRTGEVVVVAREFPGYGIVVILQHGPSYRTFYGYLAQTSVRLEDAVAKGETIGVTGVEPRSGKPRLHFRLYDGEKAVNPLRLIR